MFDLRNHGGNFGSRSGSTTQYGSYISYTTKTLKSVATTTSDYLIGIAFDENTDRFYALTTANILKVYDSNLNLISSNSLRKNTTDILYGVEFESYGVFIAKGGRIYLAGNLQIILL